MPLQRPQLEQALQRLLGALPPATLNELRACAMPHGLPRGAWLFRQGDAGDAWYVLVSGRLAVWGAPSGTDVAPEGDDPQAALGLDEAAPLAVVDPGEGVGELALLNGEPRSAGVRALRDCTLARIAVADFHALVARWPALAQGLLRMLSQRLRTRTAAPSPAAAAVRSQVLALWPLGVDAGRAEAVLHSAVLGPAALQALCATVCRALQLHGAACSVGVPELQSQGLLPTRDGGDAGLPAADHPAWAAVRARLDALAAAHPFLLLRAEPGWPAWNALLLRLADRQLLLADGRGGPGPDPSAFAPAAAPKAGPTAGIGAATAPPRLLVLLHPDDGHPPAGTARWLRALQPAAHLHIRPQRAPDIERLARALAGRSRGLVLSGGGARCFAQLGVAQAMHERGWPIDHVAGTSAGAMSAYLVADQRSAEAMRDAARRFHAARPNRGLTLPLFSLLHGRRLQRALREACGDTSIEDLWLPLAIVSSNLGTARAQVHLQGPVQPALLASAALPGLAPPQLQRGQLLFDGGLLNNLPVDVARRRWPGHVVAVDVCQDLELAWPGAHYPTPWAELGQRLRRRLLGTRTRPRPPALGELVLHSLLLSSYAQTRQMRAQADLLLRPPLTGFGLLDLHAHAALIEAGYRHALAALPAHQAHGDNEARAGCTG